MSAIHTEALTRAFDDVVVVDGLSLEIADGEIFGLVGPDGAGKTTTMRMLTGVLTPTGGRARVAGCEIGREDDRLKDQIGYMSQRFGLYPDLTVSENIQFYADIYGVPKQGRAEKIERLLGFSNLTPFRHRQAGNLSGGMKQKLGLACALIHTPRVLFLDEPTNGVDPVSRRDFWRILYQLVRERVTIFVSTAYLDEAERCNRIGLLHRGRLIGLGTPEEVKAMMPGVLVEVGSPAPRRLAAVLRERWPDAAVGLFGDRLHVATRIRSSDAEEAVATVTAQVRRLAREAGLPLDSVQRIDPSLEDVFVAVLANGDPAGAASPRHD